MFIYTVIVLFTRRHTFPYKSGLDAFQLPLENPGFFLPFWNDMEAWLQHLITQSLAWSLLAIGLVTFFESLALVGLLLPGTVLMASFGALIGSGQIGLYPAWAVGTIGCLLGDWISYFIGWQFKGPLHRWSFIKKHQKLMDKTEHALHAHSMFTIIVGRFVGPTRPLIPLVAGMLELPVRNLFRRI